MRGSRTLTPVCVCIALALAFVGRIALHAATVPSGFTEKLIASGLASPTAMQFAPDGRLFVAEQGGRLRVIKNGTLLATPFVSLTVNASGERGLLGIAFDPNFATNRFVYVYYTATTPALHNRISRFTANGDVAVAGSETIILELDNLSSATNHNGGALAFGPDGKLYAAVGDNANGANAQSLTTLHGKMLRINKDGSIPTDNPFFNSASGKNRAIWALGLRNPFTFAIHRDGRIFINDVGQNTWEEINDGIAGANYGWPLTEGPTTDARFVSPRYAYNHTSGGCAITGGAFYDPMTFQFPSGYINDYFFADFCAGWIRKLDPDGNTVTTFATGVSFPVDLKVAEDGSLYYLARGTGAATGTVTRVTFGNAPPGITQHPSSQTVTVGAPVTFSVRASGTSPLRYQWQRNGVNISGATAPDYRISAVTSSDNGARFRAIVSNDFGSVTSNEAVLTVTTNRAPTASITQPVAGSMYSPGSVISYAGSATDPEQGTLPASAFTWRVDYHHDDHTHPFVPPTSGATSGSFTTASTDEVGNVWYRIHLSVRDAGGLTHAVRRDVFPRGSGLTGAYFNNVDFTSAVMRRVDSQVNFLWGSGAPTSSMGADTFSVRWTGQVLPRFSETYTFYTVSDDGVRLWVNGQLIVNNWTDHGTTENRGTIALTGGRRYDIRMEFYERTGQAVARLLWSSPSTAKAVVPSSRLFPSSVSSTTTTTRVNFQTASASVPAGYVPDSGAVYGPRGNGLTYGWRIDNTAYARNRNAPNSPDQRYDTFTHMQWPSDSRNAIWEIGVPNATYTVRIVAGDPLYWDAVYRMSAEGVLVVNGTPTSTARWVEGTATVTVSDGRLTIGNYAGASNNKICFIEITRR
jgi:glucose/arabinose dehydrogenase